MADRVSRSGQVPANTLLDLDRCRMALGVENTRAHIEYRGDEGRPRVRRGDLARGRSGKRGDRSDYDEAVELRPQFPGDILADRTGSSTGRKRALNYLPTPRLLAGQLAERRLVGTAGPSDDIPLRRKPTIRKRLSAEHWYAKRSTRIEI